MEYARLLRQIINIQHWLNNDTVSDWQARLQRDREIALAITTNPQQSSLNQILKWWQHIEKNHDVEDVGKEVVTLFKWSAILTAFIGVVLGATTAFAVLYYDGSEPINILVAVSALVLAPLVLAIISACLPFVNPNGMIGSLNLGAMVQSVIRTRFSNFESSFRFSLLDTENFLRWRLMGYSQILGFAFAAAALVIVLLKVTLTDLAFAWGTTLNVESGVIYNIVRVVSSPWAFCLPAAAPDERLVSASQFYRLGDSANNVSASALTEWWKFLAAGLLFYGLFVRALLFVFARFKSNESLEKFFLSHPQSIALLERLNSVAITSSEDTVSSERAFPVDPLLGESAHTLDNIACIFSWHGAPTRAAVSSVTVFSIHEEADLILQQAEIASQVKNDAAVLIACKGWEPPLLEFHDFLMALRELLGTRPAIVIVPVDENGMDSSDDDRAVWQSSVAKLSDANLYVQ